MRPATVTFIANYAMRRRGQWPLRFTDWAWDRLCEWIATGTIVHEKDESDVGATPQP